MSTTTWRAHGNSALTVFLQLERAYSLALNHSLPLLHRNAVGPWFYGGTQGAHLSERLKSSIRRGCRCTAEKLMHVQSSRARIHTFDVGAVNSTT